MIRFDLLGDSMNDDMKAVAFVMALAHGMNIKTMIEAGLATEEDAVESAESIRGACDALSPTASAFANEFISALSVIIRAPKVG